VRAKASFYIEREWLHRPKCARLAPLANHHERAGSTDSLLKLGFDLGESDFFAISQLNFDCKCTSPSVFSVI
jgi:hypothetical protein